tara:strand:+ start:35135 stop:36718 length:1584 start_codon:yes stop_codon:yes gene_type:complete
MRFTFFVLFIIVINSVINPFKSLGQEGTTLELIENHNEWGWDSWVMKNGLITVSTVPEIGAKIMQFDLGNHSSMFVNPDEIGNTPTPSSGSSWPNFGGFKNWPAPQSEWNWPPPPILDFGSYEHEATYITHDSVSLEVISPVEQWRTPNLQFKRNTTIYKNSSRVKVDQTIINVADDVQEWSIWDVTQHITNHPGKTDFENFKVYFPINPESRYGSDGVRVSAASSAWLGEVADGIFGVQFLPESKKIFADSHLGWIAYVDEQEGYIYAKTFDIDESGNYPDEGARVEVWINADPLYLEVEVLSPIISLPPNGGTYTFTENWWAAKINSDPILSVNAVGAVTHFGYSPDLERLSGSFGVFHNAFARLEYLDNTGTIIESTDTVKVTPLNMFEYNEPFSISEDVDSVRMVLVDADLNKIGVLVSESVQVLTTNTEISSNLPSDFKLNQNYPNPFNPSTLISYSIPKASDVQLNIFNIIGQPVANLVNERKQSGSYTVEFSADNLPSGVYFYSIKAGTFTKTNKMLLIK